MIYMSYTFIFSVESGYSIRKLEIFPSFIHTGVQWGRASKGSKITFSLHLDITIFNNGFFLIFCAFID